MIIEIATALILAGGTAYPSDTCDDYFVWHDHLKNNLGMRIDKVWGGPIDEDVQIWVNDGTGQWVMLIVINKSTTACSYYNGNKYQG